MFDFLVQHDEVEFGAHKEPHYFNDDHEEYRHAKRLDDYLQFFNHSKRGRYMVDASTNYIYSSTAVKNILEFDPTAKLIVMLRNPVDLVVSLHSHFLFKQSETLENLEAAWQAGNLRDRAPEFVKKHPYPGHLCYREAGLLGKHYARLIDVVPERQLLTVFFDDIVDVPQDVIGRLGEFLEMDFGKEPQFAKSNQKQQVYSSRLNQLVFYPPPWLRAIKNSVKSVLPKKLIQSIDIRSLISSKKKEPREQISASLKSQMKEYFREDVQRLSEMTKRNLDAWL